LLSTVLAAAPPLHAGRNAALEALAARAVPVAAVAPGDLVADAGLPAPAAACPAGQTAPCFEATGTPQYLSVASFFDRERQAGSTDYIVKYFEPPSPGRYQVLGFTFTNNRAGSVFPHAGAIVTSAETPFFPTDTQLGLLPVTGLVGLGPDSITCVDVHSDNIVLETNQAAWLVVHLPSDTVFVGLRAEADPTDHPCDFMTRDAGDYWYRPDPTQSPYDWMITPYFAILPSRAEVDQPTWSLVKRYYR
jgi:hypothetical protein